MTVNTPGKTIAQESDVNTGEACETCQDVLYLYITHRVIFIALFLWK